MINKGKAPVPNTPEQRWVEVEIRDLLASAALGIGAGTPTDVGRSWTPPTAHPDPIALTGGIPDGPTMPVDDLRDALDVVLSAEPQEALVYGGRLGYEGLRAAVADRQSRLEGMPLDAQNFLITNGAAGAIDNVCEAFLDAGDVVITEAPTFSGSMRTIRGHMAEIAEVPLDDEGIALDGVSSAIGRAKAVGRRVKLLYVVADFHNPTGSTMSAERRTALVALCAEHKVLIMEDSAYAEIYFRSGLPPSVFSTAGGMGVLRLGTFSKSIATGLRVGWIQADPEYISALEQMRFDMGNSPLLHMALARYVESGRLDVHLERMRPIYAEKCRVLANSLAEHCGPALRFKEPDGGFFLWAECLGVPALSVSREAAENGLVFPVGSGFFMNGDDTSHLRLAFSNASLDHLADAGRRLEAAIRRA